MPFCLRCSITWQHTPGLVIIVFALLALSVFFAYIAFGGAFGVDRIVSPYGGWAMPAAYLSVLAALARCNHLALRHLARTGMAVCTRCAYPLPHRRTGVCPECGARFEWSRSVAFWRATFRRDSPLNSDRLLFRAEANTPEPPREGE